MYGQTSRAYQMLVDAYQVILERMHLKNLILPAAMIAALCGGVASKAQAEEYAQDPRVTRTLGLQTAVQVYYYDQGQPDFYTHGGDSGYATRYAEAVAKNNLMRQFFAVQSGGQFDIDFTYAQCQIGTGQTYSVGSLFNSNGPAVLVNNAPDLAAIYSSFNYHFSMVGDASNTGAATGAVSFTNVDAAGRGGGDNYWATSFGSSVAYHEFGHSLGAPHNGSFYQPTSAGSHPGYTYDFATRTYTLAPATIGGNPWTQPITSLPIGVRTQDGGNVFNRMAGGGPGTFDPLTKARFGWLKANHFAKITDPNVVALGQTATLKLYDASDLRLASKGTGANLRYGVQQGYQNVAYDASLTRLGEVFNTTTGKWTLAKQRLDFYYQGANTHYGETYPAGQVDPATQAHGIAVELGGRYIGTLQVGQTIDERTLSQMIARLGDDGDGVSAGTGTAGDYLLRPHDNPHDPRTFRTTHYRLTFQASSNADGSHTDDPLGVYANLQIESLTDMVLAGSQWDPGASGSASQDGTTGTWTTGSGSWRNLNAAVQSGSTTNLPWADGDDAVFGANAGTAGMVALGGNVSATSLTFAPVASATKYTITGGAGNSTLTLGGFGVVARDSATLACNVAFGEEQYWTVADNKTLTLSGAVTTNARNLIKMGQGTLALTGAQTWDKEVNVAEGKVVQSASQTFSSGSRLSVDSGAVYQVTGGTLALSSSVTAADVRTIVGAGEIAGMLDLVPNNPAFHGTGLLQLSSPGLITAPEVQFNSNATIEANMQLDAVGTGMHVISLQGGNGTITGDIGGAGGILLYGNNSARQLTLGGRSPHPTVNTFTGDIDIQRGSLHVVGATSLQSNGVQANKLSFNTGTGDSGRFYLEGFDRSVRDLSSAATGSAIIANSRAGNGSGGTRPANLIVTQNSNDTYRGTLVDAWNDGGGDGTAAGALGLVKKGAATLTLTGGNTYTGGTSIEAGTLRVKGADSLGTNTVRLMGGTLSIDQGQGLARTAIAGTSMNTAALTGSGSYTTDFGPLHNTTGNVVPSNTTYAYTGKIFLAAGQWNFGENFDAGAYLKINGTPILNNTQWWTSTTGSVVIAQDGWYDIDLRVFRGNGNVGPDNEDRDWTTQGIGVHFSPTTGAAPASGSSYVAFDPGALGLKLKERLSIANNISVDSDSTLEILDTESLADVHLTGTISGAGALTKTGAGMVTLKGVNTHTGATRISGGIVAAGAIDVLGSVSAYTLDNTAGVVLDLKGFNQSIGSLAGGGAVGGNIVLGGATLTVGDNNTNTSYSGTVTGTGGLRKVGTGTLRFDFANAGVASNILAPTTALTLGGGTLEWQSKNSGATNTQTLGGLTLVANTRSALKLTKIGTGTVDLRLGAITTATGATVDFQGGTAGTGSGARFSYTTVNGATIGVGARLGAFATWNGTDWAANSGTSDGAGGTYIQAFNGYVNVYNGTTSGTTVIPNIGTADVKINESTGGWGENTLATAATAINSLMMSAAGHGASVNMTGGTLTVGTGANASGGIAVALGAKGLTLGTAANQGVLTSGASGASALGLISNNAAAADGMTVNAVIANGGTGTTALTVSGGTNGGTVVLAGNNTYSGETSVVSGATLQVGAGGATGTLGLGAVALDTGTKLVFSRNDAALVVSSVISGMGVLIQGGMGTTTLTGANTYSGATTINTGGTLRIGNGTTNGSLGSAAVTNNGTLAFNPAAATSMTVSNAISGSGTVTQVGAGTTILTGTNSYGATLVSTGTLQVGNGGTIGTLGSGTVTTNGTLAFNRSDTLTVSNAIGGTGTLAQANGSSTLILTGNNAYGATTIVSGGKLQVGNGGTSGTLGSGTVTNAGTLEFNRSDTGPAVTARITGAGAVIQEGAGTTILTGANDYSGTTTVNAGILQVGNGAAAGQLGSGLVTLYGTLAFNRSDTLVVSNVFSGVGSITQAGVGTTIITSDNPLYSGAVTISAGTLQFGNGGVVGSMLAASIVNNGTLAYDHSNAVTVGGIISGTGNLIQKGSGTLTLTANNTYQGTTTVDRGTLILAGNNTATGTTTIRSGATLQIGNGGSAGSSGTGNIVDDGTLIFNRSNTLTVSSVISGSGEVIQNGTGRTIFSGTNTYAGTTTINAGGLRLTSATASIGQGALTVNTGGSFSIGSGTDYMTVGVAQAVNLNGGTLSNDQWFATLNLDGPMSVGSAGATFSTHSADSSSGSNGGINVNGVMSGSGAITLQNGRVLYGVGKVWFNNAGNTYSGTVTVPGVVHSGVVRPLLGIGASTALQNATLNLAPASSATAGTDLVAYASGLNAVTVGGLTGNTWGGMKLQNGSTAVALTVNNAVANQFDGVLSGTGSLTKTGAGTLTLTNANTHAGGTTVSGGTLALDFSASGAAASNILASGSAMTLSGGTLKIIGPSATAGTVQTFSSLTSGAGTSTLQLVQTGSAAFDVNVGALSFGSGTLNFTGLTGTAAGARVITSTSAGANDSLTQLSVASALWEGSDWASVQLDGSGNKCVVRWLGTYTNVYTGTNGVAGSQTVVIPNNAAGNIQILENGATGAPNTLAATTTTMASLLMKANVTASTIRINAGEALVVGSGANASGNVAIAATGKALTIGSVVGQGSLTAGASGAATLSLASANAASAITVNANLVNNAGSGAVSLAAGGSGAIILKGANTYTGSTTIGSGTNLQVTGSLGTAGVYAGNIIDNGTLRLSFAGNQTLSGNLTGTGTLTRDAGVSTDILTLSGASNTISGNINVTAGTLKVGAASALGSANVAMANGTTLDLNGLNAGTPLVTMGGTGVGGNGALINNVVTAGAKGSIKGLTLSADALVSNTGFILVGSTTGQDGVFDLAGHTLTKRGSGILALNGINANSDGNIVVEAGSLQIMDDYFTGVQRATTLGGTGAITIRAGAFLTTKRWASSFSLTKNIVLDGGTLRGEDPGPNGVTIASNISLTANSFVNMGGGQPSVTLSGNITSTGAFGLTFSSGATTTLSGTNSTYSGATLVNTGVLKAGVANTFSANSAFTMANAASAKLDLNNFNQAIGSLTGGGATGGNVVLGTGTLTLGAHTAAASYAGVIEGSGGLTKVGSGIQTFTKAQTYTGLTTVSGGTLALDYLSGNNIIASGNNLLLSGGTVRFDNLGTGTGKQTFGTTTLASGTSSTLERGTGWTSGVSVNLGTLNSNGGGAALEVTDIVAAPSWIRASGNLNQATLLAGAVTTNSGVNLVATDASGNLILAVVTPAGDYVRNATMPNSAGVNVRLIGSGGTGAGVTTTGFAGLSTVGTTDMATLLTAYTSGVSTVDITNSGVNGANILRMGASGAIVAAAGSTLVIGATPANGGTLTAGGAANTAGSLAFNATNDITVNAAIKNNGSGQVALTKTGAGTLTLGGANTYGGATTISQGTLATSANNALSANSALTLGGASTAGTLDMGSFTGATSGLSFGAGGGTLKMAANQTGTAQLASSGAVVLGTTNTLNLTGMSTSAGVYKLVSGSSLTGTFGTVVGLDSAYVLKYGTLNANELDAQHRATVALAADPAYNNINVRPGTQTIGVQVSNTAPTGSIAAAYSLSGSGLTGLAAGTRAAGAGFDARSGTYTATAGVNAKTVSIANTGTDAWTNTPAAVTVTQTAYDLAQAKYTGGALAFGNVRVGAVVAAKTVAVGNQAVTNAAYQDSLDVSATTGNAKVTAAGFTGLAASASGATTRNVSLSANTATAGSLATSAALTLTSNANGVAGLTNGTVTTVGTPAAITTTGAVYDYANAKYTGGALAFGNVRKGAAVTAKTVAIGNQAVTDANYQDTLDVSATTGNAKVTATGFTGLAASASGATTRNVSFMASTATAGSLATSAALTLTSNANGVAGLTNGTATTVGTPAAITTTGAVYDYANAKYTGGALAFGNVRVGTAVAAKTVAIGNQTVTDANYQDTLDVSATTGNGKVTATGFTGLAASASGATTRNVSFLANTATAGSLATSAALTLTSNANGVAGLTNGTATTVGTPAAISTTGGAYDYAAAKYTGSVLDFGNVHAGAAVAAKTVAIGNQTVTDANYQDSLDVSATTGNGKVTATGFTGLAASASGATTNNLSFGVNTATAGLLGGTATLTLTSNANGVAGLANAAATTVGTPAAITTAGQVYSGFMNWTAGSGSFATHANWTDSTNAAVHVAAGLDAAFTGVDTATFTGTGGTVNLDGANTSLNAITFGSSGNYTLGQGSGGSLTLAGTSARITAAGTQTISAPITLASNLAAAVTGASDRLTISGAIGQSGGAQSLTKTGAGTLTLTGANTYTGTTTVSGGVLALDYAGGSNRLAATSSLAMNGGEVQFINLGGNGQTFAGTGVLSGVDNKLTRSGSWTTGVVDLGTLSWVGGAMDVSNIGTSASWIKASGNAGQASLFNGSVTANNGQNAVRTDNNGFLVLALTTDYSQGGTMANNPGADIRLIPTGQGGNLPGAPITLAAGTTDVNAILNAYTAGNPAGSPVTLAIGAGNTLRLGASGSVTSAAGSDLVVSGGTLTAGGATSDTAGSINFNAGNAITVTSAVANNGTGAVSLTKTGAGTLTLSGNNTYTGTTTLGGGTVALASAGALGNTSSVAFSGGTLQYSAANQQDISGKIAGSTGPIAIDTNSQSVSFASSLAASNSGGLAKSGAGTLTLSGTNAYGGTTTISQGTLQIGAGGGTGSLGTGAVVNNSVLAFNRNNAMTVSNAISGNGSVNQIGTGTTTLSGANTYRGATTISQGTLAAGANNALSANSALTLGGASTAGTLDMGSFTGATSALNFGAGGGTLKMAASQTGTAQLVSSGAVALGSASTLNLTGMGTSAGVYKLVSGSSLTGTFGTVVGLDSAYVLKYGTLNANELDAQHRATVALVADPATHNINVRPGTQTIGVQVSNTAPTGSIAAAYSLSGSGLSGLASGTRVAGAGFDTRSGTYTAVAGVNAKTVSITNTGSDAWTNAPAAVTVTQTAYDLAQAKYAGSALDFGNVHAGATVAAKTVAIGNQTLTNAAYQDSLDVSATTGNANVTATGFTGLAASASGATTNNLSFGVNTTVAGVLDATATLTLTSNANGVAGLANGTATTVGTPTAITTTGQVYSGFMNWTAGSGSFATHANWTDSTNTAVHVAAGLDTAFTDVDTATFTGAGGTVSLDGANVNLNAITFQWMGSYTLAQGSEGSLTMAGTNARITAAGTQTISANIAMASNLDASVTGAGDRLTISGALGQSGGTRSLTKTGAGTLTLTGANTYTGTTTVSGGILALDYAGGSNRLAATSSLAMNGGEVQFINLGGNGQTFAGSGVLSGVDNKLTRGSGWTTGVVDLGTMSWVGGAMDVSNIGVGASWIKASGNASQALLFNGAVTALGGQALVATDNNGFLILAEVTDYSQGGTIASSPGSNIRLISTGLGGNLSGAAITLAAGTTDVNTILNAYTAGNPAGSPVTLAIGAGNTLRLGVSGSVTSAAGSDLVISGGTLTAGGAASDTAGSINFNAGNAITVTSAVANNGTGAVSLAKSGAGTLTLSGDNTYTGTTTVSGGTLAFTGASASLSGAVAIASGAALQIGSGSSSTAFLVGADMLNNGRVNILSGASFRLNRNITGNGKVDNRGTLTVLSGVSIAGTLDNQSGAIFNASDAAMTAGDLIFRAGSVFQVNGNTRINAASAMVEAGAKINASATGFTLGTQVPIVTTRGTVTGAVENTFDTTPSEAAPTGYRWVSASDTNHLYMGLQLSTLAPTPAAPTPPPAAAFTPQQASIARGLDKAAEGISVNPDIQAVYAALHDMSRPEQADTLQKLAGNDRSTAINAMRPQFHRMADLLQSSHTTVTMVNRDLFVDAGQSSYDSGRATALSGLPTMSQDAEPDQAAFFAYSEHNAGSKPMTGGASGNADVTGDSFTVGAHQRLGDSLSVGAAFGYDDGTNKAAGGLGSMKYQSYGVSLFLTHAFESDPNLFLSGLVSATSTEYTGSRQSYAGNASGKTSGANFAVALEMGYRLELWQNGLVTPLAGMSVLRGSIKGYQETLADAPGLALSYGKQNLAQTEAFVGAEVAQRFDLQGGLRLTPTARVLWRHQFDQTSDQVVATHFAGAPEAGFNTYLQALNADGVEVDLGASLQFGAGWNVFAQGRWFQELGRDAGHQLGVGAGLSYQF